MVLAREIAVPGMVAEYGKFADLVEGLSADDAEQPSRCAGWRVIDVAAHVIGQLSDVVNFRLEGLGTPEVTQRQVDERRGRTPAELAEELRASAKIGADLVAGFDDAAWQGPSPDGSGTSLGFGIEALWFDAYLHADDIRAALGQESVRDDGLQPSVSHIAKLLSDQGFGPKTIALDGLDRFEVTGDNTDPGTSVIAGDPLAFVLVATGRADPATLGLDPSVNVFRS
jgi:uncharacterized protein (TIGR03083 family)